MMLSRWPAMFVAFGFVTLSAWSSCPAKSAQDDPAAASRSAPARASDKIAASRVAAVTVYEGNALVTREVDVPASKGLVEIILTPLPPKRSTARCMPRRTVAKAEQ